ncbi:MULTISPECIES: TetR family transcriptional regulator C-terminal domain-containing protein [Halomonadaceae]|uniref:TetR family transcriptional regulator C-terminal domain-containing protein n=1 Tax=Halomonadaceae TaxID=28256 RepID=UPI0020C6F61C|nr:MULTISPECIES: TetR family transcriptional regulator C-terminal domain-containing protein [Halomonas]MDI4636890.1 TetR family transcriptional regulator C-terminal domain-containing protein [Halomonas sp. BMC7]
MSRKSFQRWSMDARRRSLLEATLDCVAEYGMNGASARRVAERADVTAGLIRHYFGSKDAMVSAAYGYLIGQLTSEADEAAEQGGAAPEQRLARFIVANVTAPNLSPRKVALWATFIGRVRTEPDYADIHRESYREFLVLLETLIHPLLLVLKRPADPVTCQHYAIALNALIDGLWLEGGLGHGLYDTALLPRIALSAAEGILALPANTLMQHIDAPSMSSQHVTR